MRRFRAIIGHFRLSTLLRVAPSGSIATVLREPRARLLSLYSFARAHPDLVSMWRPYPDERSVGMQALRPLDEFLSEPLIAPDTDNQVCRLILDGDARIPPLDFISRADAEATAEAAIERLETLGFVGVLELGQPTWAGLTDFFDVQLTPVRANVTSQWPDAGGRTRITEGTLDLLEQRTAADAIVYRAFLRRAGIAGADAERFSLAALAEQLTRFGESAGRAAAEQALAELREQLLRADEELADHRRWLAGIESSASWRVTAPLRTAMRTLRGIRSEGR